MKLTITLGDLVAFWGAITGTAAIVFSYLNYRREGIQVKVDVKKDWKVLHSPSHDPNELYTSLSIYNKGRRTVIITKAAYVFLKVNGGAILSDSMIYGSKELKEGKVVEFLMKQSQLDFSDIEYFAAYDAVGNTYKKNYAPFYKRYFYKFLHVTRIRKKKKVSELKKKKQSD
jgi:hypothetical protein